jgi:hypothetical protein
LIVAPLKKGDSAPREKDFEIRIVPENHGLRDHNPSTVGAVSEARAKCGGLRLVRAATQDARELDNRPFGNHLFVERQVAAS